jgi:succinylglutamate desuccinylase
MTGQSVWPSTHSARHAQHTHTHTHAQHTHTHTHTHTDTHTYIHTYIHTNKQTNKHRSDDTADGSRQWVASGGTEGQVLLWAPGGSNDALHAEGAREVGRTVQSATDVGSPG